MIASWMIYCALCALGLSVAALWAERALLAGRAPVRGVWVGALVLSLGIPGIALRYASRAERTKVEAVAAVSAATPVVATPLTLATQVAPAAAATPSHRIHWRELLARADQSLAIAWLALSVACALYFVGGLAALTLMQRRWRPHVVLGMPVFISDATGPALVGSLSPAIVVPEWALAMEPSRLALMLRHEDEHRRARDGQLLTAAQFALVAMPWNPAIWWQLSRLRAAVELDCDARVLQSADARSYGDLLLDVVRPGRGLRIIGATAFAERATQLERRIRVMARRRDGVAHGARGARAVAVAIALLALTVAWAAPHPTAPERHSARITTAPLPMPAPSPALVQPTAPDDRIDSSSGKTAAVRPTLGSSYDAATARASAERVARDAQAPRETRSAALSEVAIATLLRYGTAAIVNPMLMLLQDADSLRLTGGQADSIATLNRRYMVRLNAIWSPVSSYYVTHPGSPSAALSIGTFGRAPQESIDALIPIVGDINGLLTADQHGRLSPRIAGYLDSHNLLAIGAGETNAPGGVFLPGGGFPGPRGARGRGPAR